MKIKLINTTKYMNNISLSLEEESCSLEGKFILNSTGDIIGELSQEDKNKLSKLKIESIKLFSKDNYNLIIEINSSNEEVSSNNSINCKNNKIDYKSLKQFVNKNITGKTQVDKDNLSSFQDYLSFIKKNYNKNKDINESIKIANNLYGEDLSKNLTINHLVHNEQLLENIKSLNDKINLTIGINIKDFNRILDKFVEDLIVLGLPMDIAKMKRNEIYQDWNYTFKNYNMSSTLDDVIIYLAKNKIITEEEKKDLIKSLKLEFIDMYADEFNDEEAIIYKYGSLEKFTEQNKNKYESKNPKYTTKNKLWVDFLFTFWLGWLGIHKYRKGNTKLGLLYTFTFGIGFMGWFFDIIISLFKVIFNDIQYN